MTDAREVTFEGDIFNLERDLDLATGAGGLREAVQGAIVTIRYTATEEEASRVDDAYYREMMLEHGAVDVRIEPNITRVGPAW